MIALNEAQLLVMLTTKIKYEISWIFFSPEIMVTLNADTNEMKFSDT